ncbi:hypothetical protein [Burkholderia sp. LMG 13014]|uniref:hypothetical protein n=1 Tax=Burkholderia sp. LMG 13014 TaxID=2709306 RepID=UPI0019622C70|nr:hypothetical protein [Burkholderia sp. LMG 13014]
MKNQYQTIRYGLAGLFCFVLYTGWNSTYTTIHASAQNAEEAATRLSTEHKRFTELAPVQKRWTQSFPAAEGVRDLYGVLQLLDMPRYNLTMQTQAVQITNIQPVAYRGQQLGISRVCLQAPGASGIPLRAVDYPTLIAAAVALAHRTDLVYDSLTIQNAAVPTMVLKNPCLLLRN